MVHTHNHNFWDVSNNKPLSFVGFLSKESWKKFFSNKINLIILLEAMSIIIKISKDTFVVYEF